MNPNPAPTPKSESEWWLDVANAFEHYHRTGEHLLVDNIKATRFGLCYCVTNLTPYDGYDFDEFSSIMAKRITSYKKSHNIDSANIWPGDHKHAIDRAVLARHFSEEAKREEVATPIPTPTP